MANDFRLPPLPHLPIIAALPALREALAAHPRVVLEAPPGAGKTTVVPLALLAAAWRGPHDKILVLEPRQLAVRGAAARLAQLLGEPVGRTIGYRVRLDSKVSQDTRVEVITEGILTRMLQDDPALEGVAAVVFDEFHERSLNADLGLALALDAQAVLRPELRILIMSATLEAQRLGQWLPAPVVSSAGFLFPIDTHYLDPRRAAALPNRPGERLAALVPAQVRAALGAHAAGDVLVFLPGVADLQRSARALSDLPDDIDLHLLHGELPLEVQDAALRPARAGRRKVILATSIAETSLTIEGVRVVVDGGFARVPRFVPRTGFTTLETVPVARAAADQRRGRAGRLAPGTCYRLWTEAEHHQLPAHRAPEIQAADLSALALELALWGTANPAALRWLDAPPAAAYAQAQELLVRLGALEGSSLGQEGKGVRGYEGEGTFGKEGIVGLTSFNSPPPPLPPHPLTPTPKPTAHGRQLARLGLPPRLGHLVVRGQELGQGPAATALAALLAERDLLRWATPHDPRPLPPDLRLRLEALASGRAPLPGLALHPATLQRVRDVARHLHGRQGPKNAPANSSFADAPIGLLTALAYPDRVAQRETDGRLRLATGQRVELRTEDVDPQAEFFAVAHLAGTAAAPRATLAAPVSREELETAFAEQITTTDEVRYDPAAQRVTGRRVRRLGALRLAETVIGQPAPALVARALLAYLQEAGLAKLNWTPGARQAQQRLEFLRHHFPGPAAGEDLLASQPAASGLQNQTPSTKHQQPSTNNQAEWPASDEATLLRELPQWLGPHLAGLKSLDQVQRLDLTEPLLARLPGGWAQRQALDRLAPAALEVPSGSHVTLDYADPAAPVLAVKLQELFGLTETPTVAGGRVPLLLHLLSPGGRPAQVTRDLRSFWEKGYFEVRKDLKGRYPRHPWPDKPMEHIPTKLTKKRLG